MKLLLLFLLLTGTGARAQYSDTTLSIYFPLNGSEPDTLQMRMLGRHLNMVQEVKQVVGFADSIGSTTYNFQLSQKRANRIADILKKGYGFPPTYSVKYKGEERETGKELWKSRRVDITAVLKINPVGRKAVPEIDSPVSVLSEVIKAEVVKSLDIDNIYFLPDRAIITSESLPYIEKLARELKAYSTESFEVIGHVNYQSKKDSSVLADMYSLSRERAKVVYELLIEAGIPPNRIKYRGVGNSQPIYTNPKNEEEKKKNMRVQILIQNS